MGPGRAFPCRDFSVGLATFPDPAASKPRTRTVAEWPTAALLAPAGLDGGTPLHGAGQSLPFLEPIAAGRLPAMPADDYQPSPGGFAIAPHREHFSAEILAVVHHLVEAFADTGR